MVSWLLCSLPKHLLQAKNNASHLPGIVTQIWGLAEEENCSVLLTRPFSSPFLSGSGDCPGAQRLSPIYRMGWVPPPAFLAAQHSEILFKLIWVASRPRGRVWRVARAARTCGVAAADESMLSEGFCPCLAVIHSQGHMKGLQNPLGILCLDSPF